MAVPPVRARQSDYFAMVNHARLVGPVHYRKGVRHIILDRDALELVIDDTVFWALQEIRWMTPDTLVCRWRVNFDEDGALRDWCALRCGAVLL